MMESLADVQITSGATIENSGFINITYQGDQGSTIFTQMSPTQLRSHAMKLLMMAEAAEQESLMLRIIMNIGLPRELAKTIIDDLHVHTAIKKDG